MRKKSYVVFGLGSFGYSVAETLADCGYEVTRFSPFLPR